MSSQTKTLTFLFTDVEGSTRLWEEQPRVMQQRLEWHDNVLRTTIESSGGQVFRTAGDAFFAAFEDPHQAVGAALAIQTELQGSETEAANSISIRIAIYTGLATSRDGDFFGTALNRASRLLSICNGRQVLLSAATAELVRDWLPEDSSLVPLGNHQLRDASSPESLYQLAHANIQREFPALSTPEKFPHNLPRELTRFIGREAEIARAIELFQQTALLTLTGSGGCGKTRLALELAGDILPEFPDGVWLIELGSVTDSGLVAQTIASVLAIREVTGTPVLTTIEAFCHPKSMVLILDNCEHLVDECARVIESLLKQCPQLKILCTSREALGIFGEVSWKVPSLTLPKVADHVGVGDALHSEAIQLFLDRATAAQPTFTINDDNVDSVVQICSRLDGIPLAIQLAASRISALSVDQLASRLDDRFRILTGGSRTALPRQQTLRATIEWSYNLLDSKERLLLQRLAVFTGGWTLESAEHICAFDGIESWEVLDLLSNLNLKSLIVHEEVALGVRYSMLESLRQFAREQLFSSEEGPAVRSLHAEHYRSLAQQAEAQLSGADQVRWLRILDTEHDNIRAALEWTLVDSASDGRLLQFAKSLHRYWEVRGFIAEGRSWLGKALETDYQSDPDARMRALNALGDMEKNAGEYDSSLHRFREALDLAEKIGYDRGRAILQNNIGLVYVQQGHLREASEAFQLSASIAETTGNNLDVARAVDNLGMVLLAEGDAQKALELHAQSRQPFAEAEDHRSLAINSYHIAEAHRALEESERAQERYLESVKAAETVGMKLVLAGCQEGLGKLRLQQSNFPEARLLLESGERLRAQIGEHRSPHEQRSYEAALKTLTDQSRQSSDEPSNAEPKPMDYAETLRMFDDAT